MLHIVINTYHMLLKILRLFSVAFSEKMHTNLRYESIICDKKKKKKKKKKTLDIYEVAEIHTHSRDLNEITEASF